MKKRSYCDLIETRYWRNNDYDDDEDGGWRIEHLWYYVSGRKVSYTVCDPDGNHETLPNRELAAWRKDRETGNHEYEDWVFNTGRDPLHDYYVKRETKTTETWCALIRKNIAWHTDGATVIGFWRPGKKKVLIPPNDAPAHVREYFGVNAKGRSDDVKTEEDWQVCGISATGNVRGKIEKIVPETEESIARQLRAIIKHHRKNRGNV